MSAVAGAYVGTPPRYHRFLCIPNDGAHGGGGGGKLCRWPPLTMPGEKRLCDNGGAVAVIRLTRHMAAMRSVAGQ